jgi:hypothetical protein
MILRCGSRCDDCIRSQATLNSIKYIRLSQTDIMIVACPKHLAMIENTVMFMKYETLEDIREHSR